MDFPDPALGPHGSPLSIPHFKTHIHAEPLGLQTWRLNIYENLPFFDIQPILSAGKNNFEKFGKIWSSTVYQNFSEPCSSKTRENRAIWNLAKKRNFFRKVGIFRRQVWRPRGSMFMWFLKWGIERGDPCGSNAGSGKSIRPLDRILGPFE